MLMKFVNVYKNFKQRIRKHYLDSISHLLLHFLTLRLFENPATADILLSVCPGGSWKNLLFYCLPLHLIEHYKWQLFNWAEEMEIPYVSMVFNGSFSFVLCSVIEVLYCECATRHHHATNCWNVNNSRDNWETNDRVYTEFWHFLLLCYLEC